jgi:hypothetical protein
MDLLTVDLVGGNGESIIHVAEYFGCEIKVKLPSFARRTIGGGCPHVVLAEISAGRVEDPSPHELAES